MKAVGLIIKREFLTRVRKKTFLVLTILGPILSAAVFVLPAYLASLPGDEKVITVLDESLLMDFDKGKDELKLRYLPPDEFDLETARAFSKEQEDYAFLHVPKSSTADPDWLSRNIKIFRAGDVSIEVESYLEGRLEDQLQKEKLKANGVDPEILARTKTRVDLRTIDTDAGKETENASLIKSGIGYVAAFLIYIFIFFYGAQVMRGVIEEKTSRIVEIMISSVRPFQLMVGKVTGIALVALLQFTIWVLFGALLYLLATQWLMGDILEAAQTGEKMAQEGFAFDLFSALSTINFPLILVSFLFYFIGGYLLYAAFFAAVGSAVDKESDASQFSFPVSVPLLLALIIMIRVLTNPEGPVAFWASIVPLTSPIVMMARLPFGVPAWELILSMVLMLLAIWGALAGAAKIYRTGILMYGKKPTFKELFRWMTYRDR